MICGAIHKESGAVCELEYPHSGRRHRLSNCNPKLTIEWDDSAIADSPWNQPLTPVILKKVG
jgi:hypothetical protein